MPPFYRPIYEKVSPPISRKRELPNPDAVNSIDLLPRALHILEIGVRGMIVKKCMISDGEDKLDYWSSTKEFRLFVVLVHAFLSDGKFQSSIT